MRAAGRSDFLKRQRPQDRQLRPQPPQQTQILGLHTLGVGADAENLAQRLRQRNETGKGRRRGPSCAGGTVGQLLDPVVYADRHRLAAARATSLVGDGSDRLPADLAFSMAVQVILALFRKEFDSAQELLRVPTLQRAKQRVIAQFSVEKGCLACQLRR